jgi:hypothetical protein
MQDLDAYTLGTDSDVLTLETSTDSREAALALARQATRSLHIFTYDLEPRVYDNEPFLQAVAALARRSPHSRIQILLQNSQLVVGQGHRLVELGRRLTTYIELRRPVEPHAGLPQTFVLADEVGTLYREISARFEGTLCFNAPRQARELLKLFADAWARGIPDPGLRRLHL